MSSTPSVARRHTACSLDDCRNRVALVVGYCKYCAADYCAMHRLPETHACRCMEACRQAQFQRNADTQMQNKTVATKMVDFC
jgi:predicted nucleic acid binding AN1-type Zn finger protein